MAVLQKQKDHLMISVDDANINHIAVAMAQTAATTLAKLGME